MPRSIALTLGEPAGIGPDLTIALWRRRAELDLPPFYVIGDRNFLARRANLLGTPIAFATSTPREAGATFASAILLALSLLLIPRIGAEFMPHLDEGALWVRATMPYTISFDEAAKIVPRPPPSPVC